MKCKRHRCYDKEKSHNKCRRTSIVGLNIFRFALLYTKEEFKTAVNAREAHEGKAEQTGCNKHDGYAVHALRHVGEFKLLAHTGEDSKRYAESDSRRKGIDNALNKTEVFLDNKNCYAKNGTVGCNQWQEDTQCLIEGW